jgi:hypothetical protein
LQLAKERWGVEAMSLKDFRSLRPPHKVAWFSEGPPQITQD